MELFSGVLGVAAAVLGLLGADAVITITIIVVGVDGDDGIQAEGEARQSLRPPDAALASRMEGSSAEQGSPSVCPHASA